ncbi:hypothetical protein BHM03_00052528 [Ensete ventricosum]|nr:hypothetical protein BHM03_00052528 [Ensete ventricosum]
METPGGGSDPYGIRSPSSSAGGGSSGGPSRRYGVPFSASNLIQAPLSALLEFSGILRPGVSQSETESLIPHPELNLAHVDESSVSAVADGGEVSIRIIGSGDQESLRMASTQPQPSTAWSGGQGNSGGRGVSGESNPAFSERRGGGDGGSNSGVGEAASSSASSVSASIAAVDGPSTDAEATMTGGSNRDSSYQRYDIQQVARWIEQILPFSLLLLVVFIRQHLQGNASCIFCSWKTFENYL